MHDAMKAYHESWERELDRQFLKNDRYRKRAYICSPLSGSTAEEELSNIWRARAYMLYARTMLGYLRGSHQPWYEGRNPSCRPVGNPHYRILRRPLFGCSQAGDTGRSG